VTAARFGPAGARAQDRLAELLLVEDNACDVALAQETLAAAKICNHPWVARDGDQALRMLRQEGEFALCPRPDVILLDLNLPGRSGQEILAEIKQDPALRGIPVVVMTGSAAETEFVKSQRLPAAGYAIKPINLARIQEIVASTPNLRFAVLAAPDGQSLEACNAA
jgi:CheY-like chemotaxis protein